jgi:hypothetical protein
MKNDSSEQRELTDQVHQLAQAALRGELTQDAMSQLEALVTTDARARDIYASFILDTVILRTIAAQQEDSIGEKSKFEAIELLSLCSAKAPLPVEDAVKSQSFVDLPPAPSVLGQATSLPGRFSPLRLVSGYAIAVLAVSVFVAAISANAIFTLLGEREPKEIAAGARVAETSAPKVTPAAYLMSTNGCNWRGEPAAYTVGSSIQAGDEIALLEGVAEFRLASGVSLSVEGPATMLLASPSTLVLQRGRLLAHVPWGIADFKAIVGGYRIVAREAEFGIDCSSSKMGVHVFSGQVVCNPPPYFIANSPVSDEDEGFVAEEKSIPSPINIQESYAVEFVADVQGAIQQSNVPIDPTLFAAKMPMNGVLPISKEYVKAVKSSRPICYWRFESVEDGAIANEVDSAPSIQVDDPVSLPGDEMNHVIDLGPSRFQAKSLTSSSRIDLMETGSYSIETWLKPSHYHRGALVCLSSGGISGFVLETLPSREASATGHPATVHFFHRTKVQGSKSSPGTSCFSNNLYNLRKWQHVVAVKQPGSTRIYLDGKEVGVTKDMETPMARRLSLVIGRRWHSERYDEGNRFFVGQLDELAIYDRALKEQEIANHYKAVDFKQPVIKAVSSPDI